MIGYHATNENAAISILENGFNTEFVYFTDRKSECLDYGDTVLELEIDEDKLLYDYDHSTPSIERTDETSAFAVKPQFVKKISILN